MTGRERPSAALVDKAAELAEDAGCHQGIRCKSRRTKQCLVSMSQQHFGEEAVNARRPVLPDYRARRCGPRRMAGPGVDETTSERGDIKADKLILTYAINKPILRL